MLHARSADPMGTLQRLYHPYDPGLQQYDRTELLPAITENDWENAKESFESISNNWDSYKKIAVYFLSTDALNEVDSTICKAYYYVQMEDDSNASGEVSSLQYQLRYLGENQKPTLANIL